MRRVIILVSFMAMNITLTAQIQTVQLNSKKLQFDDGRELPAEKAFLITSEAGLMVAMIKMQVANTDFTKSKILYESKWKRKDEDKGSVAILPNHYKLRSGNDYYFRFIYYRKIRETEQRQIRGMLEKTAKTLLESNILLKETKYKFLISPDELFQSLNAVIEEGMVNYETRSGTAKPVFSGVIKNMLYTMSKRRIANDSTGPASGNIFNSLLNQVNNEIEMIANNYLYVVNESITVPDYPVEKKQRTLALNLGYAGIYNNGSFSDLDYYSAPYAGISFPLGNRVFDGRFWNNTSISAGVFLKDFKNTDSTSVSGPVVKRPIYAAFGYRVFNYLKIHAGAAILEDSNNTNNSKSVYLKPFVGLSLELNLWLGIGKK